MKVRSGFVSNSSSSSFVVAWPKKPENALETRVMLFADDTEYPNPYQWGNNPDSYPSMVSERVLGMAEWDEKQVRESLVGDFNSHISYLIYEAGEGRRNTFTYNRENDELVSTFELAGDELQGIVADLAQKYPRVNWKGRVEEAIERHRKYRKIEDALNKEIHALEEKLSKEHGCERLPWKDSSKMTEEEKAAFEKARDDNSKHYTNTVYKDPRYKKAQEKRGKVFRKSRDSKKIEETLSLMANRLADMFYAENEGAVFSVCEIHDDSNLGSAMEHGNLFDRLPYKKFSHH